MNLIKYYKSLSASKDKVYELFQKNGVQLFTDIFNDDELKKMEKLMRNKFNSTKANSFMSSSRNISNGSSNIEGLEVARDYNINPMILELKEYERYIASENWAYSVRYKRVWNETLDKRKECYENWFKKFGSHSNNWLVDFLKQVPIREGTYDCDN